MNSTELAPNSENSQVLVDMIQALESGDKQGFLETQTTDILWDVDGDLIPLGQGQFFNPNLNPLAGEWFGAAGLSQSVGDFFDITQQSGLDHLQVTLCVT